VAWHRKGLNSTAAPTTRALLVTALLTYVAWWLTTYIRYDLLFSKGECIRIQLKSFLSSLKVSGPKSAHQSNLAQIENQGLSLLI
jgi:hypothetical protein